MEGELSLYYTLYTIHRYAVCLCQISSPEKAYCSIFLLTHRIHHKTFSFPCQPQVSWKKKKKRKPGPKEIESNAKYPLFLFSGEKKILKLPASDGKQVMGSKGGTIEWRLLYWPPTSRYASILRIPFAWKNGFAFIVQYSARSTQLVRLRSPVIILPRYWLATSERPWNFKISSSPKCKKSSHYLGPIRWYQEPIRDWNLSMLYGVWSYSVQCGILDELRPPE
jgi:hypothetical protein